MKTFNAREVLDIEYDKYSNYDCLYNISGMSKILNFETGDTHQWRPWISIHQQSFLNNKPNFEFDDIYFNKFIKPLAHFFEELYNDKVYHKYVRPPSFTDFSNIPFCAICIPTKLTTEPLTGCIDNFVCSYNDLIKAKRNNYKISGFVAEMRTDMMTQQQIIPLIRPVAEHIATYIVEFCKELKNQGKLNSGILINNQFFPPMFWTSDEDISLDEIMDQVDKYLERYIFYRKLSQGKTAITEKYTVPLALLGYDIEACDFTNSVPLQLAGYHLEGCAFTNEDILKELEQIGIHFNSEIEELEYINKLKWHNPLNNYTDIENQN